MKPISKEILRTHSTHISGKVVNFITALGDFEALFESTKICENELVTELVLIMMVETLPLEYILALSSRLRSRTLPRSLGGEPNARQ